MVLVFLHEYLLLHISVTGYLTFYVYILSVLLLPMEQRSELVMLIAVLFGSVMDMISGTSALCTMSLVCVAFVRRGVLKLVVPPDILLVGGLPLSSRVGVGVFLRYCFLLSFVYGVVYFGVELMSFMHFGSFLLRLLFSTVLNGVLIFLFQLPFRGSFYS